MTRADTDLVMICTSDVAGKVRGKAIPRKAIEARSETGIGWTPTNVFITAFGPIAPSPFGALGDLCIRPDFSTSVDLDLPDFGIDESFVLGDILELDGMPWSCCLRGALRAALDRLKERHGITLKASFEHEFHYFGTEPQPGLGYSLRAYRRLGPFANRVMAILDAAGLSIDTFMPEYGPAQCEVTVGPKPALRAADEAVILRELVRATARGMGSRASFAPILDPSGVGNGVHVHFSLYEENGAPISYDASAENGVSRRAGSFVAGILAHLPDFTAMTAASVPSYLRLTPHRWSAAYNNFGKQDRESAVRICPIFAAEADIARKFHYEFRAADAATSPYLLLAALVHAGLSGLDEGLATPPVTEEDVSELSEAQLAERSLQRLPQDLESALDRLSASAWARQAFGDTLIDAFESHKRTEIEIMAGLTDEEVCARYAEAY